MKQKYCLDDFLRQVKLKKKNYLNNLKIKARIIYNDFQKTMF